MPKTAVAKKARQIQASFDQQFESPLADELEAMRGLARWKRRIVYDCFEPRIWVRAGYDQEHRVSCEHDQLDERGKDGSISLLEVLRGRGLTVCQTCLFYDDEDPPISEAPKDDYSKIAPVRCYSSQQVKVHIRGEKPHHRYRVATLCGRQCGGDWAAVDGDDPVTCSKCLRQWQEISTT